MTIERDRTSTFDCDHQPQGSQPSQIIEMKAAVMDDTTEMRLQPILERMKFFKASNTIRRTGWYFTENYPPCGVQ